MQKRRQWIRSFQERVDRQELELMKKTDARQTDFDEICIQARANVHTSPAYRPRNPGPLLPPESKAKPRSFNRLTESEEMANYMRQ